MALALASLLWSTTYVIAKPVLEVVPPLTLALARFGLAAVILIPIGLRQPGPLPSRRALLALGFFGVTGFYVCLNVGLKLTSASAAALINGAGPAVTALVALPVVGERLRPIGVVGLIFSGLGVGLIVLSEAASGGGGAPLLGGLLVFGSSLSWAIYTALARRLARYGALRLTAAAAMVGTLLLVPLAAAELLTVAVPPPSGPTIIAVLYMALGPSAAAYLLWTAGLRVVPANQAGAFLNLVPVGGVVLAALVLGDLPPPGALLGGGLVLAGVWLTTRLGHGGQPRRGALRRPGVPSSAPSR